MGNKKNPLIINIILLSALLCFTNSGMAAGPVELENLREAFTTAKQGVINESQRKAAINNYIQQLTALATDLRIYKHDIAGANVVRREIRKAKKELDADPADLALAAQPEPRPVFTKPAPTPEPKPAPAPKPVIAKSAPKPVMPVPASKPVVAKPKPRPVMPIPASKPVVAKPKPKPIMPAPAPKPVVATPVPKLFIPAPAPKPVASKPKPKPIARKKPTPKPIKTKPTPKPAVVATPMANPAPQKEHTPQTHVSSMRGLAGSADLTRDNIYTFNLTGIGSSTILAFWATGRSSIDTYGKVWLITPDNRRIFLRIWKESSFEYSANEISSFYKLRPITEDITRKVTKPGIYKVEFEWTEGKEPLVIYRVEITS